MNMLEETRELMSRLLRHDPIGLASLSVIGSTPATLAISVADGEIPVPGPHIGPGHRRQIVAGVVQRMQQRRWSAYDDFLLSLPLPDDSMLDALHDKHPACVSPFECNAGWVWLLDACFDYVSELAPDADWKSSQIKEKFAGLRLYHYGDTGPDGDDIIDAAESISVHVCDICGGIGRRRTGGWMVTRCDQHADYVEI